MVQCWSRCENFIRNFSRFSFFWCRQGLSVAPTRLCIEPLTLPAGVEPSPPSVCSPRMCGRFVLPLMYGSRCFSTKKFLSTSSVVWCLFICNVDGNHKLENKRIASLHIEWRTHSHGSLLSNWQLGFGYFCAHTFRKHMKLVLIHTQWSVRVQQTSRNIVFQHVPSRSRLVRLTIGCHESTIIWK